MLGEILEQTRRKKPMVHCMVNLVTDKDCADLVPACGESPIMAADAPISEGKQPGKA